MKRSILAMCASWMALSLMPNGAEAADTVETWDVGLTDVDFYAGFDGIGARDEHAMYGDIMLGAGLAERFSAYLGTTLTADDTFSSGTANIYLGVFGTPVDTDHFDMDLFLDIGAGGTGLSELALTPSVELNFDLDPDLQTWGLYLRTGVPIYGMVEDEGSGEHQRIVDVEFNPGTYVTVREGHQLLLEYDMVYSRKEVDIGGIALGYNVVATEPIELITQLYFGLPQRDEKFTLGVMVGFIATLPS